MGNQKLPVVEGIIIMIGLILLLAQSITRKTLTLPILYDEVEVFSVSGVFVSILIVFIPTIIILIKIFWKNK